MGKPAVYGFLEFVLDTRRHELLKSNTTTPMTAQSLELLAYLIEHRHRVVTREELFAALWHGVCVSDGALSQAVWEVRRAIGSHACIETVRGVGYRFACEVQLREECATAASRQGEFVGRVSERDRMMVALRAAGEGRGRAMLVTGPVGAGKTRLCWEIVEHAQAQLWAVLRASARQHLGAPPLWPWIQLLDWQLQPSCIPRLRATTRELGGRRQLAAPDGLAQRWLESQHELRFQLIQEIIDAITKQATEVRTLFWIDDLDLSDPSTCELLPLLTHALAARKAFLLLSARLPCSAQDSLIEVVREYPHEWIELQPLAEGATARLLELYRAGSGVLATQVRALAAGNALLTVEIARSLHAEGLVPAALPSLLELADVRPAFANFIRVLPEATRSTLRGAAAIGLEFHYAEVAAFLKVGLEQVIAAITELEALALVREVPDEPGHFRFVQPVVRAAVRATTPWMERMAYLHRAAEQIEQFDPFGSELSRASGRADHALESLDERTLGGSSSSRLSQRAHRGPSS